MDISRVTSRTSSMVATIITGTAGTLAGATTALAGAVGGAAIGGTIGALRGTAEGVVHGAESGRRSTPALVLTAAALGITGVLDWPLLLAAGGTAYAVDRFTRNPPTEKVPSSPAARPTRSAATRRAPAAAGAKQ